MACNEFVIQNLSYEIVESTIRELIRTGASVIGQNPYSVNLNKHGVKLNAEFNSSNNTLAILVKNKKFYVSCRRIENELRNKVRMY